MSELQENRGPEIISLTVLFLAVTWTLFILRVYARFWISKANGADDWFAFIALVSAQTELNQSYLFVLRERGSFRNQCSYSLFGAFVLASVHYGLGRHESDLAQDRAIEARMVTFYRPSAYVIYALKICLVLRAIYDHLHCLRGSRQTQHWVFTAPTCGDSAIHIHDHRQYGTGDFVVSR